MDNIVAHGSTSSMDRGNFLPAACIVRGYHRRLLVSPKNIHDLFFFVCLDR